MQSLHRKNATLTERMNKIEKQNRLLKSCMAVLSASLFALVLMGAKAGLHDGHFRQIVAEGISIVDDTGKEIILIGSKEKEGAGIRILNKAGKRILGIGITADEMGSGILVADKDGTPRIGLGLEENVPSIAITDKNGKKILAMGGDAEGYGLVIMDANEVERAGIGFKEGDVGVVIYDDTGQYVRGMIRQKNGTHYTSYVDENGKEIIAR